MTGAYSHGYVFSKSCSLPLPLNPSSFHPFPSVLPFSPIHSTTGIPVSSPPSTPHPLFIPLLPSPYSTSRAALYCPPPSHLLPPSRTSPFSPPLPPPSPLLTPSLPPSTICSSPSFSHQTLPERATVSFHQTSPRELRSPPSVSLHSA